MNPDVKSFLNAAAKSTLIGALKGGAFGGLFALYGHFSGSRSALSSATRQDNTSLVGVAMGLSVLEVMSQSMNKFLPFIFAGAGGFHGFFNATPQLQRARPFVYGTMLAMMAAYASSDNSAAEELSNDAPRAGM